MTKFITKFPIIAILALLLGTIAGCEDPKAQTGGNEGKFSVSFKEAGPGYVVLNITASTELDAAYSIGTAKRNISNPSILFASGKKVKVGAEETLRISADIQETTEYYVYIAAKLSADKYSEIFEINFTTEDFEFANLLTVVGVEPDGYKMQITVPKSVKTGKSAIRYNQCDLMMYNYQTSPKYGGNDDYFTLLYNASAFTTEDTTLEYSESVNWDEAGADINEDGVIDENDITIKWNPISPGEPIVFVAGEFEWMEIPEDWDNEKNYSVNGFDYPAGWDPGYYLPCLDSEAYWGYYGITKGINIIDATVNTDIDKFWTGAFQRKIFTVKQPEKMDAKVNIEVADIGPVNATVIMTPEEGVEQFAYGIFDDAALNIMKELCDGKEEFFQWAVSSFFGVYTFGTGVSAGVTEIELEDIFVSVPSNSNIHVLVTAMGNSNATVQSFNSFTFQTTEKSMGAPEIIVTPLEDESSPFLAAFNIKCTTYNDPTRGAVDECYYGANYKKDFILEANREGSSYFSLAQSQPFTDAEIKMINSAEGYTIKIPSIDGETTRLAVAGFNVENTPNDFNFRDITECPAVADCTTPFRDYKPYVKSDLFETLTGEWTATATLSDKTVHKSRINLSNGITEGVHYPSELPDSIYTIYKEVADYEKAEVDGMFEEFKTQADIYNKNRIEYQNSILMEGWIDKDKYGRLNYYTPWDLFISREYSGVDVKSMFSDFGPKVYLEVSEGDKLSISGDMYYMPPVSYTSIPYYLAGYSPDRTSAEGNVVFYNIYETETYTPLTFPVELSADGNTLTIKAWKDSEGITWYPNLVGSDVTGYVIDAMIVSDIVLTRGWNEKSSTSVSAPATKAGSNYNMPAGELPGFGYKSLTRFDKPVKKTHIKATVATESSVMERLDKFGETLKSMNE